VIGPVAVSVEEVIVDSVAGEQVIPSGDEEQIRRKTPRSPGVYVEGSIHGVNVWFTVDTGASRTILSDRVFKKIAKERQPELKNYTDPPLEQAGGIPLSESGVSEMELVFNRFQDDPLKLRIEVAVADIKDEVLLGLDAGDTVDVLASKNQVLIDGQAVPCICVKSSRVGKVRASGRYAVPAYSEAILEAVVDTNNDDLQGEVIIEPTPTFSERHSLIMASSLVDLTKDQVCQVRVLNPFDKSVVIHKDTVLGYAESFGEVLNQVVEVEDEQELGNLHSVRRLQFCQPSKLEVGQAVRQLSKEGDQELCNVNVGMCCSKKAQPDQDPLNSVLPEHVQNLFETATEGKTSEEKDAIQKLLVEFGDTFSKDESDLGLTTITEHRIDTGNARPVKQAPRRVPAALIDEEKQAVDQLLKQGVIQESSSPWASPIVLVKKKNGKVRACIDYRKLNAVTVKDAYPIPSTQECLDALSGAVYFSTLDMTSGYNQIPVRKEDIPKTALVTRQGLFEFKTMPFGLTNAPATFQHVMEIAMRGLQWTSCLIYLDDIIIFGSTFQEHLDRLRQVLQRVRVANLKLKPEKCALFQAEVPFLGHIVSGDGIRPNPENIAKVKAWEVPRNVTEVKQFLGLCSYYRRFVKGFSVISKPLTNLTCNNSDLVWTAECQDAFDRLKEALTTDSIVGYPQGDGEFILDTDACDTGIGAVLSQVQDGVEKVIAYASRSMNKAERNYCVTDKELLAVRYFVEYFRHYLLGRRFSVRTDHQALKWLFSLKEPRGRIARWLEILSTYDFSIEYRPGKKHGNADGMSRYPNPKDCHCADDDQLGSLKCGPCKKCRKRAEEMQSSWFNKAHDDEPTERVSRLAEGGLMCTIATCVWVLINLPLSLLLIVAQGALSVIGTMGYGMLWLCKCLGGNVLVRVSHDVLNQVLDDGRLKPKLGSLPTLITGMGCYIHGLISCRISRVETRASSHPPQAEAWFQDHSSAHLQKVQREDPNIGQVLAWLGVGSRPTPKLMCSANPELRHYWNLWGSLEIHNGLLFKRSQKKDGTHSHLQLLVPKVLRKEVLEASHSRAWSGHLGCKRTSARLCRRYYWFALREDVSTWIAQCDACAANKPSTRKPKAQVGDMRVGAPLDRLCIDVLGPFPASESGNKYILVVCDAFTKWVEVFAMPDQMASTCAKILVNEIIVRYGCPLDLHTDQGRNFEGAIFKELCELLQIRKTRTSPYHPQCNGQCERFNRTLLSMIRASIDGQQELWDQQLAILTAAYRATPHENTGLTPNMMMLGREVRLPGEFASLPATETTSPGAYCMKLRAGLEEAHEYARQNLHKVALKQSAKYDAKASLNTYKVGDLVWYLAESRSEGLCPKLQPLYQGPAVVVKKMNDLNSVIQLDKKGTKRLVHHDKIKPYKGTHSLPWAKRALQDTKI